MLLLDSDNALGSPGGDVDDGLALAALWKSGLPISAVSSVGGNTSEEWADRNNRRLGELCGYPGPYLRGVERLELWATAEKIAALGPLTNVAAALARTALAAREVVLVGGNASSQGRFPPWWPHEFNLTKDPDATRAVFASNLPLTVVPLDVARRLRVGRAELAALQGPLGEQIRQHSRRWQRRSLLLRGSGRFPAFDLVAAIWLIEPSLIETEETGARLHPNLWVEFGKGGRPVRLVRGFDPAAVWGRFRELVR